MPHKEIVVLISIALFEDLDKGIYIIGHCKDYIIGFGIVALRHALTALIKINHKVLLLQIGFESLITKGETERTRTMKNHKSSFVFKGTVNIGGHICTPISQVNGFVNTVSFRAGACTHYKD